MIALIKRLVRRLRGVCLACGEEPIEGCHHCWDCSLRIVGDLDDETKAEELAERYVSLKPAYYEEEDPIDQPKIGSVASKF